MKNINPQSMLRVGATLQMGKYRIERYLSSGGFGNTYVAYNTEFEETIAIKEFFLKGVNQRDCNNTTVSVSNSDNLAMFAEQLNKFKKEARRIRKLHNPHIVAVHDLFEENGTAYYVMDYVDGESLAERLKRLGRPLDEQEVRGYLPQLLDALQTIHAQDIWHLDLKPGNIMVDRQGTVRLIDFGASKQASSGGATTSTATAYTEGYAPSEQMEQNVAKYGPWTDLYALGATIYNLLTCNHPPKPSDINELAGRAFTFATPVTDDIKQLILWLMSTNRQHRPQTAAEVLARIATFKPIATTDDVTIIAPPSDAPTATEGASSPSKLEGVGGSVSGTGGMAATSSPSKLEGARGSVSRSANSQPTNKRKGKPRPKVTKKNRMRLYTLAGIAAVAVLVFTVIMLSNRGRVEPVPEDTTPTLSSQSSQSSQHSQSSQRQTPQVIQNLIANMVYVEGGSFTMGATSEQGADAYSDENPAHQVTLSSFSIGKYEVTQAEWQAVMGSNPSSFTGNSQRPVEQVSWNDCQEFIRKLNAMTGKRFRLPTEAEWEYAARGGNRSRGYKYAGSNTLGNVAWYYDNSGSTTHPVGTKSSNELGLYDMSGNVQEWCQDWYGSYSSSAQSNPTGPASGSSRVRRGGSWLRSAWDCRVSLRLYSTPSGASRNLGLRLAL